MANQYILISDTDKGSTVLDCIYGVFTSKIRAEQARQKMFDEGGFISADHLIEKSIDTPALHIMKLQQNILYKIVKPFKEK